MYRVYDHVGHQHLIRSRSNVESLAGEPESPNALAVPINAINAIVSSQLTLQME